MTIEFSMQMLAYLNTILLFRPSAFYNVGVAMVYGLLDLSFVAMLIWYSEEEIDYFRNCR
jgi:hypothetical protein